MPKMVRFTVDEHGVFRFLPMAGERVQPFDEWPTTAEMGGISSRNEPGSGKVWFTSNDHGRISKTGPHQPSEETTSTLCNPRRATSTTKERRLPHHGKYGGARGLKLKRLRFRGRLRQAHVGANGTIPGDRGLPMEDNPKLETAKAGEAAGDPLLEPQGAEPSLPAEFQSGLVLYSFSL